jgi:hypothetical protein
MEGKETRLRPEEREILGALALGLELRKLDDGWRFVGSSQNEAMSNVPLTIIRNLLAADLIVEQDCNVRITDVGTSALRESIEAIIRGGIAWNLSPGSRSETF